MSTSSLGPLQLAMASRPDPRIPYGESIEAIKQLVDEGVAREAGVSNASIEQMDIAQEILGNKLIAVQNQFSPIYTETADTLASRVDLPAAGVEGRMDRLHAHVGAKVVLDCQRHFAQADRRGVEWAHCAVQYHLFSLWWPL